MGSLSHAQSVTPDQDLPASTPDTDQHQQPYGNAAAGAGLGGGAPPPDGRPPLWFARTGGGEVTVCPFDAEDQDASIPGVELILGQEPRYPFFEAALRPKGLRAEHQALLREFGVDPTGIDAATAARLAQALDEVQDLQACVDGLDGGCEALGDGAHDHSLTLPIEGEQTETWSTATAERGVTLTVVTAPDGSVRRSLRYTDVCGGLVEGSVSLNHDEATPQTPSPDVATPTAEDEEGLASFFEGAIGGDLADNDSWSALAGQTLVGFIPIAGQLADVRDTAAALKDYDDGKDGAGLNLLLAMISFIPGGDLLKAGKRTLQKMAKGIVPGAAESLVTKNLDEGVEAVSEQGAKQATKEGVEALSDEVRARFVAALGEEATERILKRFGAKAMAHYGPEFLGSLKGVTEETMEHLLTASVGANKKISGCHDQDMFLDFVEKEGLWEITKTTPHPDNPLVTIYEYRPYKMNKDGSLVDPKEFKGGKAEVKSVIKGLDTQRADWQTAMTKGFDEAIRTLDIPKDDKSITIVVHGLSMSGYLQNGVVTTLWPAVKGSTNDAL
ncbi:hypothetical protein L6R49_22670 [Myxococcota bacterium]|nr:hypothetical protein [Myxococcota bacterium]